jgi:hypothetical protein
VNDLGLCTIDHSEDEIPPSLPPFGSLFIYTLYVWESSPLPRHLGRLQALLYRLLGLRRREGRQEIPSCNKDSTTMRPEVSGTADALAGASETKQRRQAQHKKRYPKSRRKQRRGMGQLLVDVFNMKLLGSFC